MRLRGRIIALNTDGGTPGYGIVCEGESGVFTFPVDGRFLQDLIEREGRIFEQEIEYDDKTKELRFLD